MSSEIEIDRFRVDMPEDAIADLRRRITATRRPSRELVTDRSQGVQLATIQELARYWASDYDWRACEARLNALPQFKTGIDGVDIHFIYVRSGGDVGASVTDAMGRQGPGGLAGIHMNLLVTALGGGPMPADTEQERAALEQTKTFRATGFGYFLEQATRPQTIGYALLDSPLALAAWMLDHDTDAYEKITRAFVDGQPSGGLTRDHILDNITVYWLTGTGASAARSYWENGRAQALAAGQPSPPVKLPVGFTTFPGEIFAAPRSWVELGYPNLTYFHEAGRGGHFAAWEEPELFATEIRAAFTSLR